MSKFTDIFIQRPVLAMVVSFLILLVGLNSLFKLELRQYPKTENAVITITTAYPGASPDVMQGFITQPIQSSIASADGVDYISSSSILGVSTIQVYLRLNFPQAAAFADILAKVNAVRNQLPKDAMDPVLSTASASAVALLYANYASEKLSSPQVYDFIQRVVQPRLQSVPGVASVNIIGGTPFAMRIWLDQGQMAAFGVTPIDVFNALNQNSYISAAGQLRGEYTITNINAQTDLHSVEEFEKIIVRSTASRVIRISDVAKVELGSQDYNSSVYFNGIKGLFIGINGLPSANPLTVIENVRKVFPDIERELPPSLQQVIVYDSTKFISAAIDDVIKTLAEATAIVILVMFLFLASFRAVIVPVVTIPLSLIGVGFAMYAMGYSINLLTLLAMVLAIGLVVDDAIVVVENSARHIEEGKSPFEAAVIGAREIAMPVISMTITLAAVYAPIGMMGGLTGALFKEFALTLAASVIVSGIVALTLSPMMCSKILKPHSQENRFAKFVDKTFTRLEHFYEKKLHDILQFRSVALLFGSVVLVSVAFLFVLTPKELSPKEDQGFLMAITTGPSYANVQYLEQFGKEINKIFADRPEQEGYFVINGMGSENTGFAGIVLKPWGDRKLGALALQKVLQQEISNVAGLNAFVIAPPDLPTGSSGFPIQFIIKTTDDYRTLYDVSQKIATKASESGFFIVVDTDLKFDMPQLNLTFNRDKASEMGVSMQTIGSSLATLLGGNYINLFSMDGRSYQVITQLPDAKRVTQEDLSQVYISNTQGTLVALSNFAEFNFTTQPSSLNQFQQLNAVTFSAVPAPGQTSQAGLNYLMKTADELMPKSMSYDFAGDSRTEMSEGNALVYTFLFALVVIFLVLAAQFESFRDPFVIMLSVPMAICGALIPLNLGFGTINIYTQIGLVTLVGLITKHGILMVEFANQLRRQEHMDKFAAIHKAASVRLRPILMTTAAMVLGVIPLVLASGAGAASRHAIGLVIASGLTIGTLFTLFIVPTMYTYIAKNKLTPLPELPPDTPTAPH